MSDDTDPIYCLGVYGDRPDAQAPPLTLSDWGRPDASGRALQKYLERRGAANLDVIEGIDVCDLASAGWGVVLPDDLDPKIEDALAPLLQRRAQQAGARYQRIVYGGERKATFLRRHECGSGPVDPAYLPYYLMLVGNPTQISYRFQRQMDVQYAMGRLDLKTPNDYAIYARGVLAAEDAGKAKQGRLDLFGPAHDRGSRLTQRLMMVPLAKQLDGHQDWRVSGHWGKHATREKLLNLMTGSEPRILLTGSHGLMYAADDPRQRSQQGALLCAEWPGTGKPSDDQIFKASDLGDSDLSGLISFHYACFSAGTPEHDEFSMVEGKTAAQLAQSPFTAALAQAMLSHEHGPALAFVGHVERAWLHSFRNAWGAGWTSAFESMVRRVMAGYPLGAATEHINQRYAELAAELTECREAQLLGEEIDPAHAAHLWTSHNDARGYVILGDPAVRHALEGS